MKTKKPLLLLVASGAINLMFLAACSNVSDTSSEPAHEHSYSEGKCECGAEDSNYVPPHVHSYNSVVTQPTCTEGGYTTYTCDCGDSYTSDEVSALDHTYVDGKCDCGAEEPHKHSYNSVVTEPTCTTSGYTTYTCDCGHSYVADEVDPVDHTYNSVTTQPTCTTGGYTTYTCDCGHSYVADEVGPVDHTYVEGKCECGAEDPNYVAPLPSGSADFNTIVPKNPSGDSSYTSTYTTTSGWTTYNSAIQSGGSTDMNPQYTVIGPDNSYRAVCLNGKTSAPGKLTSPTLTGGLTELTINYTKIFTDTELSVTVTVTELSTGNVYTHVIAQTLDKNEKYVVYTDTWTLDNPVYGEYTIVIENNCPSNLNSNKDRFTILSVDWVGAPDVHFHNYVEDVTLAPTCTTTGSATYTCSCGDTYTEELPVAEHVDTNLDITCDFEGCTKRILPAADSKISLFTAQHMIIMSLSNNYYVEGVVTEIVDAKNGLIVITDSEGYSILIRLPKNADGVSYANWTINKVVVGDTISVYGKPSRNSDSSTSYLTTKVEGGVLTVVSHTHDFAEADCVTPATCACLATTGEALGHNDADNSGFCDRCEWNMKHDIDSVKTYFQEVKETENYDATAGTVLFVGEDANVTLSKGAGSINTSATTHIRWTAKNDITVATKNGENIASIVFVASATSYVDELEALLTAAGYTFTTNGVEVTINVENVNSVTITNSTSKQTRLVEVKVIFEISQEQN